MSMTKAEKEAFDRMQTDLRLARALRWPIGPTPKPMTVDEIKAECHHASSAYGEVAIGWFMNAYSMRVTRGCSNGYTHNVEGTSCTTSQGPGAMYRTEADAWVAMLHIKVRDYARDLAQIEFHISRSAYPEKSQEAAE